MRLHPKRREGGERQLGEGFWWVFAASTLTCLIAGGSTTLMAAYARDQLGASPGVIGLVIGSSSIVAIALRPTLGRLADRHGVRRVAVIGCAGVALGSLLLIAAHSVLPGTAGRIVFGLTTAAANTALIAWVIGLAPVEHRGKALGIFGVSVWIGLALGPQLSQTLSSAAGYTAVWAACGVIGFLAAACVARARPPVAARGEPAPRGDTARILRLVLRPGLASGIAWMAEGLVLAFLVVHLEGRGLPATGLDGAATVFTVFAITVIASRLVLVSLVDRLGAVPTAAGALGTVGVAMVLLALAQSFPVAALGGMLLGVGYAPLFPALALLATAPLEPHERGNGVGIFSAFMDAGIAAGAAFGGIVVAWVGSGAALGALGAAQALAVFLVLGADASAVEQPGGVRDEHAVEEIVADSAAVEVGHDAP